MEELKTKLIIKTNTIENILLFIFAIRPIIDLAWDRELFLGMNLAGVVAILIIALTAIEIFFVKRITFTKTAVYALFFTFYILLITAIYSTTFTDYNYVLRLLSEIPFLLIVAPNISIRKMKKTIFIFTMVTLIPIILTYLQVLGIVKYTFYDYIMGAQLWRGSGGYHQPSVLTRFCGLGLLYTLYLMESSSFFKRKTIAYVYMVLNIVAVILSYHRTGYLLTFLTFLLWFYLKDKRKLLKFFLKGFLTIIVILTIFFLVYKSGILSIDISGIISMISFSNIVKVSSAGKTVLNLRGRGDLLMILLRSFKEAPWVYTVFGNGVNVNSTTNIGIPIADMELIRVLWDGGIAGGILWMLQFGTMKKNINKCKGIRPINAEYRLAICTFWMFILWGFTIEATESPDLMYHIYLICGLFCHKKHVNDMIRETMC